MRPVASTSSSSATGLPSHTTHPPPAPPRPHPGGIPSHRGEGERTSEREPLEAATLVLDVPPERDTPLPHPEAGKTGEKGGGTVGHGV
jgi:hypothetical protein